MILYVANKIAIQGRTRTETLNGRDYLVAPATIIVEGVLNGSQGALYYPAEELARSPSDWDGMPLVTHPTKSPHPTDNGQPPDKGGKPVSARNPKVLSEQGVGWIFNTQYDDETHRLVTEAWFDIENTKRVDERVLTALLNGTPIELSTGLYTQNEDAENGATFNDIPYDYIARNYKPDHLAILYDDVGACSVVDGCGILVNTDTVNLSLSGVETMKRGELITWLVANCDCWKGKDDKETLNKLSDDKLKFLKQKAEERKKQDDALKLAQGWIIAVNKKLGTNAEGEGESAPDVDTAELAKFFGVSIDPGSDPAGFIKELLAAMDKVRTKLAGSAEVTPEEPAVQEEVEEEDEYAGMSEEEKKKKMAEMNKEKDKKKDGTATTNKNKGKKEMTLKEWEESMPEEARPLWNSSKTLVRRAHTDVVNKLKVVANKTKNKDKKVLIENRLSVKPALSIEQLEELLVLVDEGQTTNNQAHEEETLSGWLGAGLGLNNQHHREAQVDKSAVVVPPGYDD